MAPVASSSSAPSAASSHAAPTTNAAAPRSHNNTSSSPPTYPSTSLPTIHQLLLHENIVATSKHIAARLLAIAESFLFLRDGTRPLDPLTWENDLCSATFYATYALCVDPTNTRARRILAKCARLGGFNVVLPFSPSGSAASSSVTPSRISSVDSNDRAGAQAAIWILQNGSADTFTDVGCAREYREACHTLGRSSDAAQASGIIASSAALGKRKAEQAADVEPHQPPQLVPVESRYEAQVKTDLAFDATRCHRFSEAAAFFREALERDPWNWRALTGLCDLGGDITVDNVLSVQHVTDAYTEQSQTLLSPTTAPSDAEELTAALATSLCPKAGEEASNKKAKVSGEPSSDIPEPSRVTRASSVPKPTRAPVSTSSQQAASKVQARADVQRLNGHSSSDAAVRPPASSRALSNARTITNQQLVASQVDQNDEKPAVKVVGKGRVTRTMANHALSRSTGMQLRSSNARTGVNGRAAARSAAPSQASSVASATSTSTSRSTASAASSRSGLSGRRTPATSHDTAAESTSVRSAGPARNGAGSAASAKPVVPASRTTAASRWATQSNGAASRAPTSALAASRRVAAVEEAAQREAARILAELAERQRAAALEAVRELATWLAADLAIFGLLKQLGEAYKHVRKFDGQSAVATLTTEPSSSAAKLGEVTAASAGGKAAAEAPFTEPLAACWRNTVVYQCLLGRAYNEMAQYAKAEVHFRLARKMNPYLLAHMDIYSLVLFQLNREVALAGLAQELALIEPKSAATQIVVGNAFALQRENQTALVSFQRAAAMAPDYAYAYTLAGHEAYDLSSHDQAIAYFRSAIRCDRRHWNAWAGLGRVFLAMGGHELPACQSLQQAIKINPKNHVLWDLVGWTYAQIGRRQSALEAYDKAISLAPRLAVLTYLRRSELLATEGEDEAAHVDLISAFELAPEEATIHLLLAQSYMRMGDGSFCKLEEGGNSGGGSGGATGRGGAATIKASGQMRLPAHFQAEITHHLAVAVDLDPGLLKVVKALGEGWRTNPGNRIAMNPADLSNASGYEDGYMDYSDVSGEVLEDEDVDEEGEEEGGAGGQHHHHQQYHHHHEG